MQFNHTISAVLRGRWMLERSWAFDHLPLVAMMLKGQDIAVVDNNGKKLSFVERTGNQVQERPFVIDPKTMMRYESSIWDWRQERYVPNPNIPEGSVGVISFNGPITKYNGSCGEAGTISKAASLADMQKRSHISAIVQIIDTPGGETRAAHNYVSLAKKSSKPIISFVDDTCASLGVIFSTTSSETFFSHDLCQLGSIGSYCTLFDFRGYLDKEGIKMHEIYAPQSTEKNKDYKDALEGNYESIEAELALHVDAFISHVSNSRKGLPASSVESWKTGKMFYAKDAIKMGLADGIMPLEQVVSRAAWLGNKIKK